MTITQEDARPLPLIGQSVGQAQASLTRLLTGILAGSGTSYQTWLGLQRLNALGEPARDAYQRDVRDWLLLDAPAAAGLAGDLVAAGLAETDGDTIRMTEAARRLRQHVIAESAQVTGPVLATVDRADLEITIRTLNEITRRVRATFGTEES
jgi:DNA-binding MarR family transcriptional regulator